ncbi:MAG: hypothetical protein ACRDYC_10990 [Acidimicrobiales bacterium]
MSPKEQGWAYLLAGVLGVTAIYNQADTHETGLAIGALAVAAAVSLTTWRMQNRLVTSVLALVAGLLNSIPQLPKKETASLFFILTHYLSLFGPIIFAILLAQRQRKGEKLAYPNGRRPASTRPRRGAKAEPPAPSGPPKSARYTPPKPKKPEGPTRPGR